MTVGPDPAHPPSSKPSLRDRRRDYTLNEIARVAITMFDERGFDSVTVEELAEGVGISPRTFFRYFSTKDEVLLREHDRVQRRLVRALAQRPPEESGVDALRNAYVESATVPPEQLAATATYGRVQLQTPMLNARSIGFQALANEQIIALVAQRMRVDPQHDPRPEIIALAMNSVAAATFRRWVATGVDDSLPGSIDHALAILVEGLGHHG